MIIIIADFLINIILKLCVLIILKVTGINVMRNFPKHQQKNDLECENISTHRTFTITTLTASVPPAHHHQHPAKKLPFQPLDPQRQRHHHHHHPHHLPASFTAALGLTGIATVVR